MLLVVSLIRLEELLFVVEDEYHGGFSSDRRRRCRACRFGAVEAVKVIKVRSFVVRVGTNGVMETIFEAVK